MSTIFPEQYLHVIDNHSGNEWIIPFSDTDPLDLRVNLDKWIKSEFAGELEIDGAIMPKLDGDYYGKIITDGRPTDSGVVWQSGGFYLKSTLN